MPLASVTTASTCAIAPDHTKSCEELRIQNNSGEVVYFREAPRALTIAGATDAGLVLPATMDAPFVFQGGAARCGYMMIHGGTGTKAVAWDRSNFKSSS